MFSDRYGLTAAVLSGRKTQTRGIIKGDVPLGNWSETVKHSRYKIGEVVAVAQCYNDFYNDECDPRMFPSGAGWTNKLFVKPDLMPNRIRITDVRVERLREITDADCMAEGVEKVSECDNLYHVPVFHKSGKISHIHGSSPHAVYAALIDRISGKGTRESNPWVFVYDFELVK